MNNFRRPFFAMFLYVWQLSRKNGPGSFLQLLCGWQGNLHIRPHANTFAVTALDPHIGIAQAGHALNVTVVALEDI